MKAAPRGFVYLPSAMTKDFPLREQKFLWAVEEETLGPYVIPLARILTEDIAVSLYKHGILQACPHSGRSCRDNQPLGAQCRCGYTFPLHFLLKLFSQWFRKG